MLFKIYSCYGCSTCSMLGFNIYTPITIPAWFINCNYRLLADTSPWFALACALYTTRAVILCWFELPHNASSCTTTGIRTHVCADASSYSRLKPFCLSIMERRKKVFGTKGLAGINVCDQVIATTAVILQWCQNGHISVSFRSYCLAVEDEIIRRTSKHQMIFNFWDMNPLLDMSAVIANVPVTPKAYWHFYALRSVASTYIRTVSQRCR